MLEVPTAVHKLDRQPIEQLGMNRPIALRAEIIHDGGDARAKELFPEPVHNRPRGERIVARNQPVRQIQPRKTPPLGVGNLRQEMRHGGLDDLAAFILPVAARQHACDHRFPSRRHHRGRFAATTLQRFAMEVRVLRVGIVVPRRAQKIGFIHQLEAGAGRFG